MKRLLKKVKRFVIKLYKKLTGKLEEILPIVIHTIEGLKKITDTYTDEVLLEIIKKSIPGKADDVLIDKVHKAVVDYLPKLIFQLNLVYELNELDSVEYKLKVIMTYIKDMDKESKKMIYHGFASLLIDKMADGKLTWSESVHLSEYAYRRILKHENSIEGN